MSKEDVGLALSNIQDEVSADPDEKDWRHNAIHNLINMVIEMHRAGRCECQAEMDRSLVLLKEMYGALSPDKMLFDFAEAFFFYASGEYDRYLESIGSYLEKYIKAKKAISYETAETMFLTIFDTVNQDDPNLQKEKFLRKFHTLLKQHCPDSAFELYIRYRRAKTTNSNILEKYLLSVVEKDDLWAVAYRHLGYIYYRRSEWQKATEFFEKAMSSSELQKTDSLYFSLAWAYAARKEHQNAEAAYRKCLALNPNCQYANNNLGHSLDRQKRYEEALLCYDKSMELKSDGFYPYRNKFDTLKKMGRTEDAVEHVKTYPQYFNTKHYRNEVQKIVGSSKDLADLFASLEETTESDFAGEMIVADAMSGIALYPHQQDAIRRMNKVILNAEDYAGLLVLPTGGGKTLTATYWLMESLLDKGGKIIWLAHRHELLDQAQRSFEKVCYKDIAKNTPSYHWRIISGRHDKPLHIKPTDDIIIASKTSLKRGLSYFMENWLKENGDHAFLIIDEAHHATASEYRELIDSMKANCKRFKMLGLTATPFRTADSEQGQLKKMFPDDILYKIDLRELINRGILSEPIFKSISTDVDMIQLFEASHSEDALERIAHESFFDIDSIGRETAAAIANNSKRNSAIVNEYTKNRDIYKQTLVFALNVDMALVLNGLFKEAGIRSDFVVSDIRDMVTKVTISSEENAAKIQKFRDGELDVLVNVNILTEGTDLPKVQSVFLTRPTKSTILMTQMIGRALRGEKAGGTKDAYIVSFIDDWQDRIAWVNPEQLFIDENVDFTKKDHETQKMAMRLVSIAKIEEFARIANDTIDKRLSDIDFIERIPVGIYKFSYLVENGEEEELDRSCNVLVYDCMKAAYEELMAWLPTADLADVEAAAGHVDATLFGTLDMLLGYSRQDAVDIIRYFKQTQDLPQMIYLAERKDYDIATLARHIIDNELTPSARRDYIDSEWNRSDTHWAAFFGIENQKAFRKLLNDAIDRIENPEDYAKPTVKPMTEKEKVQIQTLPLYEIRRRFPELEEKIRDAVFTKYTDADGFYYSALSNHRSKNRLDFQIDHITPMAHGGLTVLDNLQLLTRNENMGKSDGQPKE